MPYGGGRTSGGLINAAVNGDCQVCQIATPNVTSGVSITGVTGLYTSADMWPVLPNTGVAVAPDFEGVALDHPLLGTLGYSREWLLNAAAPGLGGNGYVVFENAIEARNIAPLIGQTGVRMTFWVKSGFTGNHYVVLHAAEIGANYGALFIASYRVAQANVWQQINMGISLPAASFPGVAANASTMGLGVLFPLLADAARLTANVNAWIPSAVLDRGPVAGLDFQAYGGGAQFNVTDLMITKGSGTFPRKIFQEELADCLRYYWQTFPYNTTPAFSASQLGAATYQASVGGNSLSQVALRHPVSMRIAPAIGRWGKVALPNNWWNGTQNIASDTAVISGPYTDNDVSPIYNGQVATDNANDELYMHLSFDARMRVS